MKKYFRRILSWLLTFALLLQLAPSMVFAADDNSASSAPAVVGDAPDTPTETTYDDDASPPDAQVVGEVTEYRNESEKHFRMDDGSFIAVDYGVPVHYDSMTKLGKILTTPWFYRTPTILKSQPIASTLQTTFQHIPLKTAKTTNPLPRTFQPVFSFRHNAGIPACGFVCPKTKPCPQMNPQPKTKNQKK